MSIPSSTSTLLLDPDIRDWVVLPLFVIMVAAGLLRQSLGIVLQGSPVKQPYIQARSVNVLKQCMRIQSGAAHYLTTYRWHCRRQHVLQVLHDEADWCEAEQEKLENAEKGEDGGGDGDPMSNMMNPMSMMKGNMAFMVQNMIMMQGIQHFFSGFILLKVPFPLTTGFKSMFQRGLGTELPDLDSSYVSSVSWYFLVMYGLKSFLQLVMGDPPLEMREQDMRMRQYGMMMPGKSNNGTAMAQQLRQEGENLEVFLQQHKSEFDTVEKRVLGKRYPKKLKASGEDSHDALFSGAETAKKSKAASKKKKTT